jgi:hypothetical protein
VQLFQSFLEVVLDVAKRLRGRILRLAQFAQQLLQHLDLLLLRLIS